MRGLLLTLATGACLLLAPAAGDAASHDATTCGFITASVPYSASGHAKSWRVYVTGKASCATARNVLDAVMHLRGKAHEHGSQAGSYFTYGGWVCPFGQMGEQSCALPLSSSPGGPFRAHALARSCSGFEESCPAKLPASEI